VLFQDLVLNNVNQKGKRNGSSDYLEHIMKKLGTTIMNKEQMKLRRAENFTWSNGPRRVIQWECFLFWHVSKLGP
jgi:hypothetical protein